MLFVVLGVAVLGAALLPPLLSSRSLSFPVVYVALGMVVFALPLPFDPPDPREDTALFERLAEVTVIIALMSTALKLDRVPGLRSWASAWRLLGITMPLTIVAIWLLGWGFVGLAPATAALLAAALAPTDPTLAADVQVRRPYEEHEQEVRVALTSEAGLNDSLAFPFVNAAILMAVAGAAPGAWFGEWLAVDVTYRLVVGTVVGAALGWGLAEVVFRLVERDQIDDLSGFTSLAATFLIYGLTEIAGGYGFLAVFVAGLALRHHGGSHAYHERLHDFAEETERIFVVLVLLLVGGAVDVGVLGSLTWQGAILAVVAVLVVRPAAGLVGLLRSPLSVRRRAVIAFFGIRGIGSIFYLAHGLGAAEFPGADLAWSILVLVILVSVVLHGVSSSPVMRRVEGGSSA